MNRQKNRWKMVGLLAVLIFFVFSVVVVNGASEKVKINFWTLNSQVDLTKKVIADFMAANPNIEVALTLNGTDDHKKNLKIAASSDTLPDLWYNWGGSLASFYSENGLTLDLTAYAKQHKWSQKFMPAALNMCKFNGQLSGMPMDISGIGIYYNKQMFAKYKIKVPKTFAQLETAMKILKANGITPISTAGKNGWLVMRINEALLEHFAGPQLHDKLASLETSWNDPRVVKMYAKFKEWNEKGYFPQGFITLDPNGDKLALYADQAAMVVRESAFDTTVTIDKQDNKKYGWFPFPTDQKPIRISSYVHMLQFSKKSSPAAQAAALKFAEFFYSDTEIRKYVNGYNYPLALNSAKPPIEVPNVPAIAQTLNKNGSWLISDQALPQEIINCFFQTQDAVIIGSMTPEQAAKAMAEETAKYKAASK